MEKQKLEQQITLEIEELEERIAPGTLSITLTGAGQSPGSPAGPVPGTIAAPINITVEAGSGVS